MEPSPDLLPRRPTFLRVATLKGPAQARSQTPLHVPLLCTFRRPKTHKDTVGHSGHLCTQEVAHGVHLTLGSQTSTNTAMSALPLPMLSSPQTLKHSLRHTVFTDTHKHSHTQGHAKQNKCRPVTQCPLSSTTTTPLHVDVNTGTQCMSLRSPCTRGQANTVTTVFPAAPEITTLTKVSGYRDTTCLPRGYLA